VRFEFMEAEKETFEVVAMCRALGVSKSGFYDWCSREPSARDKRRAELSVKVKAVYDRSRGTYGSPRVREQLTNMGETVSEKTVAKVMHEDGLRARRKKKFKATTDSRSNNRIAPNVLNRDFVADQPNQVWVTDVTALWTLAGWVFLAAIIDLFSRRVVGWAMSESNDTELALAALNRATSDRKPPRGLVHHSDRGSPYGSDDYVAALEALEATRSMSRKGDCWDNAVAESFFASLEHECIRGRTFSSYADALATVAEYVDNFYNPERLHSTIGYVSPVEFELRFALHREAA
jgi:transposase InsO family protein